MAHAMKASAGYLSPPHPDHIGQKALMEENRKEVCLVLLSPNRRQEQCLTRGKKKKNRAVFSHQSQSVSREKRWRSSSGMAEGRCEKKLLGMKQGYREKGECCSKDGKRGKTYMEKTRKSTDEEDAKKKNI